MSNIQLLLLAAGSSRRMKAPKQLLPWGTITLIEHQIQNLLNTRRSLSVVVGAYAEKIIPVINSLPVAIVCNKNWEQGMGISIAHGVQQVLEEHPNLNGILISLIDQPLLTTSHFEKMLQSFEPEKRQIIVSEVDGNWSGAPVLFDKVYVEELMNLQGDQGAKVVINTHKDCVKFVDGGDLLVDIDTHEIYQQVLSQFKKFDP